MAKFQPEKWKPSDDSSIGYRTLDPTCVVLNMAYGQRVGCPCGCGGVPSGPKATFCMGHDARLRGILIRAHLMGVRIRYYVDGKLGEPIDPYDVAGAHVWKSYLDAAVMKREGKNREVLRRAIKSERLIRVGRWETTGQVVAVFRTNNVDMYEVEYVNKAGESKKVRIPAEDAPPAQEAGKAA